MANITESGWYNLSVPGEEDLTFSESKVVWGVLDATINTIYKLSSEPVSDGSSLTTANWSRLNDDATLSPYNGYWVYLTLREWVQKHQIIGENNNDKIGWSVDISKDGTVLAVGKPGIDQVDVYETTDGGETWTQKGSSIDPVNSSVVYGESVSVNSDGSIIAIGDPTGNFAEVYEYNSDDSEWTQLGSTLQVKYDENGDEITSYGVLQRVQLDSNGNTIILGDRDNDLVNVYSYENGEWALKGNALKGTEGEKFGCAVGINSDGTIIAVGSQFSESKKGAVTVYEYSSGDWAIKGTTQYGANDGDRMGSQVKLNADGTILAAGSSYGDNDEESTTDTGYVRIWQYQNDDWVQIGDDIQGTETDDNCCKIGMNDDGDRIIIGFPGHTATDETPEGFVRTYVYNSSDDSWDQNGETLNGIEENDVFGYSVSMNDSGDTIAVGSPFYPYDADSYSYNGLVQIHKLESY